jgi:hypothetical protein
MVRQKKKEKKKRKKTIKGYGSAATFYSDMDSIYCCLITPSPPPNFAHAS